MKFATKDSPGPLPLRYAEGPANGPALLLLHGVTRGWREWEALMPGLAGDWHLFVLDQRGHGSSARAASYHVTDFIEDAVRFVRDVVRDPVVIHGHSLGAMVAAGVATQLPDQVRGISLEDPPFHTMGHHIAASMWEAQFTGMREVARAGGTIEELADALAEIRLPTAGGGTIRFGQVRDRAALRWSAECLSQLDPEVLTPIIESHWLDDYDIHAIFPHIRCPVLLLQADPAAGGALTDAEALEVEAALHDCTHLHFPKTSHMIHREQSSAMLEAFRKFAAPLRA